MKRTVLSNIARIYDPLGLIGPIVTEVKSILQNLWQLKLSWDESLPQELSKKWIDYINSLSEVNKIRIPRIICPNNIAGTIELHGFGDASTKAYGACIYAVSLDETGILTSHLVCSKSRIAPLRTISIPRLELCAALLLAKLMNIVSQEFGSKVLATHLWSDSQIVLAWIQSTPSQLKTFVANRVSKIQRLSNPDTWRHVNSVENPANILSRGSPGDKLILNTLWWTGPQWLLSREWPQSSNAKIIDIPEQKSIFLNVSSQVLEVLHKFSSYKKLQRIIAHCNRFIDMKCRTKKLSLTVDELRNAEFSIARMVQQESFFIQLRILQREKVVGTKSKLLPLKPFLDEKGLIRIRLQQANIPWAQQHPIILPPGHFIINLMMREEHVRLLHCGPEQLLSSVCQNYWPLSGRREATKVTHKCIKCYRMRPTIPDLIMGNLPRERVLGGSRPFINCGVDYAGPIQYRSNHKRGRQPTFKAYIAVFTCLSTKAVHLELVTQLTTECFLAALKRFTSRRGLCAQIFSDNGTSFVGANKELLEIYEFLRSSDETITTNLFNQKISWKFMPPRAAHCGGLWEAAVKITKRHLYTVTQGLVLTFEEAYTLLTQIEAVMNSRSLIPLSSDPQDLSTLTPAHFIIGDSLASPVE